MSPAELALRRSRLAAPLAGVAEELPDAYRLTLIARHTEIERAEIVLTDDDLAKAAATLAHHAPSGWQPISTAPRDGSAVLIFSPDARTPQLCIASWCEDGWYDVWDDITGTPIDADPTHWLPLPAQPKGPSR